MTELNSTLATWLATYFVHSTLLLGAAWVSIRLLSPSLPLEETLWKCALILGIVSSVLFTAIDRRGGSSATQPNPAILMPVLEVTEPPAAPSPVAQRPQTTGTASGIAFPSIDWMKWAAFVPLLWLAGLLVGLGRIANGQRRLLSTIGSRKLVTDADLLVDLSDVREAAGFRRPVCLTSSRRLVSPLAIGSVEIAVCEGVMGSLTRAQRVSVLAHEMAHLMRRDPMWRLFGSIVSAVFFFQPLNRVATRRMTEISEFLADGAAGRNGHHIALAECLTNIAGRISAADPYAVALTGTPSMLLRRVQRLLSMVEYQRPRVVSRLAAVAPLVLVVGLAPDIDLRQHDPLDTPALDSAAIDRQFKGRLLNDTELVYTNNHNGNARERIILRAHRVVIGRDGSSLEGVLPGGHLEMITTGATFAHRRVILRRDKTGTVSRTYWHDGSVAPFDADDSDWMITSFQKLIAWSTKVAQAKS